MVGGHESIVIASMWAWFTPTVLFGVTNLIIATLFIASKSNTKHRDHDENDNQNGQNQNTNQNQNPNQNDSQYQYQYQNESQSQNYDENENHQIHEYSFIPRIPIVSTILIPRIPIVSTILDRAKSINLASIIPTIIPAIITKTIKIQEIPKYTSLSRLAQSIHFKCKYDSQPDSKRYPSNKPTPPPTLLGKLKPIDFSSIYATSENTTSPPRELPQVPSKSPTTPIVTKKKKNSVKKQTIEIKKMRSEVRNVSDEEENVILRRPESARARMNADDDAKAENFITKFREQLKMQRSESLVRYNDMLNRPY